MKRISVSARSAVILMIGLIHLEALAVNEWSEFYNNSRSLAMGGASVAITSDDTSLFRNPANLGSIRQLYGTLFDPEIEGTGSLTATRTDISGVMSDLSTRQDTYYRAKSQISPTIVSRNFGFGLINKTEINAEIQSATPTVMDTFYRSDVGAIMGINLRLFDGRIKIGAAGRMFNRIEVNNPSLAVAGPTDLGTIGTEGTAVGVDGGLLIQAPWTYLPTIGVVVHDVGGTVFNPSGIRITTAAQPAKVEQSTDVALALFPIHSNNVRSVWTIEYSDVTNSRLDTDNAKRAHFGWELNVRDVFFFRLGYNQRYLTGGIEVASENIVWQLTSYGEEIGTQAAPRQDRRLNTKLIFRF